jgi:hypothetical protein
MCCKGMEIIKFKKSRIVRTDGSEEGGLAPGSSPALAEANILCDKVHKCSKDLSYFSVKYEICVDLKATGIKWCRQRYLRLSGNKDNPPQKWQSQWRWRFPDPARELSH